MRPLAAAVAALIGCSVAPAAGAATGDIQHRGLYINDAAGDNDGWLEPGEPFKLRETVRNTSEVDRTNVLGTLSGRAILGLSATTSPYPDLAAGALGRGLQPFVGHVGRSAVCGRFQPLQLALASDQGEDSVPFRIPLGAREPLPRQRSADVPKTIPDADPAGVSSTLTVADSFLVRDVDVRVGRLVHPAPADLTISLTRPGRAPIVLAAAHGGDGGNYVGTIFDAEAATPIADASPPFTGRFAPDSDALPSVYGRSAQGTWTLTAVDGVAGDTGRLYAWGLDLTRSVCSVAPHAKFTATRAVVGQPVHFDASSSVDVDGEIVNFSWDLDGNGSYETNTHRKRRASHTYNQARSLFPGLRARDDDGNESFFRLPLRVRRK